MNSRLHGIFRAYAELMKPELTGLSVCTTLAGFYLGSSGPFPVWTFIATGIGACGIGGGAAAMNEYIERRFDAMMKRTERRPLPTGRLHPSEALAFGLAVSVIGLLFFAAFTNPLTTLLAAVIWFSYVAVYTPLKRVTSFSTVIGGIPGAIPPMMGWTAARNEISPEAWVLFAILFCWQMPHFFALAWMYRKDYSRAGFKILSVVDRYGRKTGFQVVLYTLALLPASILPTTIGLTGRTTLAAAILLGISFLWLGILLFATSYQRTTGAPGSVNLLARRVFFASLVYLPMLLVFMILDKV